MEETLSEDTYMLWLEKQMHIEAGVKGVVGKDLGWCLRCGMVAISWNDSISLYQCRNPVCQTKLTAKEYEIMKSSAPKLNKCPSCNLQSSSWIDYYKIYQCTNPECRKWYVDRDYRKLMVGTKTGSEQQELIRPEIRDSSKNLSKALRRPKNNPFDPEHPGYYKGEWERKHPWKTLFRRIQKLLGVSR
jgi:hypothetical protein